MLARVRRCIGSIGLAATLLSCAPASQPPLQQHVYVWQRQWQPDHHTALAQSRASLHELRVLLAQFQPSLYAASPWSSSHLDQALLQHDGRPLTLVIRLDGRVNQLPLQSLLQQLERIEPATAWQRLEIDYDCPRAQLPSYLAWLTALRQRLPAQIKLDITALPDWLHSADFATITAHVDRTTLQLHSVLPAQRGLFDLALAKQWTTLMARQSRGSWFVALPAYHSAMLQYDGNILLESEVPLAVPGERHELRIDPTQMQQYVTWLTQQQFAKLQGVAWFRLPLASDRRSWPWSTLQALASAQPLRANLQLTWQPSPHGRMLVARNSGNIAVALPQTIQLQSQTCLAADGLAGYHWLLHTQQLTRQTTEYLLPDQQRQLGWFRCKQVSVASQAEPLTTGF